MNKPRRLLRSQERTFSAHHMLLHVAALELGSARAEKVGRFNRCLIAITFSALAVEALVNAVGDKVYPDWQDFESSSPLAKSRLLAEHLGVTYQPARAPWTTLRWLATFRNRIAHPKLEEIRTESVVTEQEFDNSLFKPPPSKLEREVTLGNASKAVEAVKTLKALLTDSLTPEQKFGLTADMWSDGAKLHEA